MSQIKLEAVTVCVGYGDFLRETAAVNHSHLDHWVIVTSAKDHETRDVCRQYGLECVLSGEHERDGAFSKGRAITRGLAHTAADGWLLHIDADIALPADVRDLLGEAHLDESFLYGCDRFNVRGYERWRALRTSPAGLMSRLSGWMIPTNREPIGARVANREHGYTPIGFFQLWHGSATAPSHLYPLQHGTAARTDVQFAFKWDRRKRSLLPEVIVYHLESAGAPMGANWSGRTTPRFGPALTGASTTQSGSYE